MAPVTFKAAHLNIQRDRKPRTVQNELNKLLQTPNLSIAGFNEGADYYDLLTNALPDGWNSFNPDTVRPLTQNPIAWKETVWGPVQQHSYFLHAGTRYYPERWLNAVVLEHLKTGFQLCYCEVQMTSHVEKGGEPRKGKNGQYTNRVKDFFTGLEITQINLREFVLDFPVILGGDLNVDYSADKRAGNSKFPYKVLERDAGFKSNWSALGDPAGGTHTSRDIDYLYFKCLKNNGKLNMVNQNIVDAGEGDHKALIGTFKYEPAA